MIRLDFPFVCDPTSDEPSSIRTLWIDGERIVAEPTGATRIESVLDLKNCIAMAGGIDPHTHIGGGKVNIARLMWPERHSLEHKDRVEFQKRLAEHKVCLASKPLSCPVPSTIETGRRYLQMGYTACFEPAMVPSGARHAHLEMGDTPFLDTGGYLMLGNESLLLEMISEGLGPDFLQNYVAWMLEAHRSLAVKVVHPSGVSSFKYGVAQHHLEEKHPQFGTTAREVLFELARAVDALGVSHPIHVHCTNLGMPGNIEVTLETIRAVEGHRIHLTHAQFHCYGAEGPHGFSSAADRLADVVNRSPQVSIDVGQVLFGQTVTLSGDLGHQWEHRDLARPKKGFFQEIETQGGCGVLPFRYRESQYVHSLQWTIGLELFLRIQNPWQIFLTTDHPNGAPFTSYPHLIRLLMDYEYRMECLSQLHEDVKTTSCLSSLHREYTLDEIAIITRAAPARSLGLNDRGSLRPGSLADLAIYERSENIEQMFANPKLVIRRGKVVLSEGEIHASCSKESLRSRVTFDEGFTQFLKPRWSKYYQQGLGGVPISDDESIAMGHELTGNVVAGSIGDP